MQKFMVIEHFKNADARPVRDRFAQKGRMIPAGTTYQASWIDGAQARCFQLMEAESLEVLEVWTRHWDDLIDFEIIPVSTSEDYWSQF